MTKNSTIVESGTFRNLWNDLFRGLPIDTNSNVRTEITYVEPAQVQFQFTYLLISKSDISVYPQNHTNITSILMPKNSILI